jgi:hypothetical protein
MAQEPINLGPTQRAVAPQVAGNAANRIGMGEHQPLGLLDQHGTDRSPFG